MRRRMAWALLAGRNKAEAAQAAGISLDYAQALLEQPGMFLLLNSWQNFIWRRQMGGFRFIAVLIMAMLRYLLAGRGQKRGPGELAMLVAACFGSATLGTLRSLCRLMDLCAAKPGVSTEPFSVMRVGLIDILANVLEAEFESATRAQHDRALLADHDRAFKSLIMAGELPLMQAGSTPLETFLARPALVSLAEPAPVAPIAPEPISALILRFDRSKVPRCSMPPLVLPLPIERAA